MGCGASTAAPPSTSGDAPVAMKPLPGTVDVVLALGMEVSGKSELCEQLVKTISSSGRHAAHLELQSLIKAEVASGSDLGGDISILIQQGKIVPKGKMAEVVKAALASAPPGVYLLEGYPTSEAALKGMATDIGIAPKLALLCKLEEEEAKTRLSTSHDEPGVLHKMKSFNLHMRNVIAELEKQQLLCSIDMSAGADAALATAKAAIEGATPSGGG